MTGLPLGGDQARARHALEALEVRWCRVRGQVRETFPQSSIDRGRHVGIVIVPGLKAGIVRSIGPNRVRRWRGPAAASASGGR